MSLTRRGEVVLAGVLAAPAVVGGLLLGAHVDRQALALRPCPAEKMMVPNGTPCPTR